MQQQAQSVDLENIITMANVMELVKRTIAKVGLEYIAPLPEAIQDEKISKAITATARGEQQ